MPRQTVAKQVVALDARLEALEDRKAGMTYQQIGDKHGHTKQWAHKAIKWALKQLPQEPAEMVRALELERLDRWLLALDARILNGDDKAVDTALRISKRRADLLGLDAPTKQIVDQVTAVRVEFADDYAPAPDRAASDDPAQ